MSSVALYHYYCHDGITAALAAHLAINRDGKGNGPLRLVPNTVYNSLTVEDLNLKGAETVYLLDFAGPPGFAIDVANACQQCIFLDHHKTAAEHLLNSETPLPSNLDVSHIDMGRSGATIALDYFKPDGLTDDQIFFFKYVEDSDLWRWALPDSRAFYAWLVHSGLNYDCRANPGIFEELLALKPADIINEGKVVLEEQQRRIKTAVADAVVINLGGAKGQGAGWGQGLAVAGQDVANIRGELGNALAEEAKRQGLRAVGAVVYREGDMGEGVVKVSLRSMGKEDTTVISQAFGGGGHLNASSFLVTGTEFATWK